jgi:hypothetical protein
MFHVTVKSVIVYVSVEMNRLLFSKCFALMWLLLVSPVLVFGQVSPGLPYRSIVVDGDPGDWGGIPALVVDVEQDSGVQYDQEDIKAVYGANDDENVYFLMELWSWVVPYYNVGGFMSEYRFYLDIIPGGDPSNNSADYYIEFWEQEGEVGQRSNGYSLGVELHYWDGSGWYTACECEGVQGDRTESFIEVSVPWECIGGSSCFNCFFYAHYEEDIVVNASDYAPDQDAPVVVIGCCPWEPPVGGELIALNYLQPAAVLIAVLILMGACLHLVQCRRTIDPVVC